MNQNKSFFILTAAIGAILAVIATGLYLSQSANNAGGKGRSYSTKIASGAEINRLKTQELLDFSPVNEEEYASQPPSVPALHPSQAIGKSLTPKMSVPTHEKYFSTQDGPHTYATSQRPQTAETAAASSRISYTNVPQGSLYAPHSAAGTNTFVSAQPTSQVPASQMPFAPYMDSLTKEQAEKLDKQLNGLTERVEAAILRAFLPKSKKDANIEKYLAHQGKADVPSANKTTPFANVTRQMNHQKAGLVASMKNAFGTKAASQAGKIMDAYQQEIMNVLNQPGLTQTQIQQKTHQISKKYNKQLQKLSEKSGLEHMENERIQQDKAFEEDLAKSYGSKTAGGLGEIMDKYRQQEMQLAQQGLPAEEYYEKMHANQRQRRKEMEQFLIQNGHSLNGLLDAENNQERSRIDQQLQAQEEGKILPKIYRASEEEKNAFIHNLTQERDEKVQLAQTVYGAEGAQQVNAVYDRHAKEAAKIMEDEETSLLEKQQLLMQARQKTNEEIKRIQNSPEMKTLRATKQADETLGQMLKDPSLAQATAEQKTQFEEKARPVLLQMYERIYTVAEDSTLTDEQKQQQIQAIQQEAHRQLAGQ